MPLIKAANTPPSLQAFSMRDIESHARGILARAREEAEGAVAAARTEAEQIKAAAHAEGLAEGLAAGQAQGLKAGRDGAINEHRAKLTELVAGLTVAAKSLDESRRSLESSAVYDVVNLAIAIAQRATKRLGVLDPAVAIENVNEAMKLVSHASDVRIALHPRQVATLREALPALKTQWPTLSHVELVEDAELAPGGCRVFTSAGRIDGDLDEQLRRIAADLVPGEEA